MLVFGLAKIPFTSHSSIRKYILHTLNSNTGPNGIPYFAYNIAAKVASSILAVTSQLGQSCQGFYYGFSDCEALFPPKGYKPLDPKQVVRHPSETRPLKRQNHDNNILAGERNAAMCKFTKRHASHIQNGFIKVGTFRVMLWGLMLLLGLLLTLSIGTYFLSLYFLIL